MAEPRINLNNYKSSGVYTVEIDASENVVLPLTTGRLIVGSSRVGPFNTVVLINDTRTLRAVFGEIDAKLEKAGSYFHRTLEVALREGPVFAMNVLPLDTDITAPVSNNLDQAAFTTFNTESAANNNDAVAITHEYPIVEFFNRQRLWFADYTKLNKSKNLALGDDYITSPGGFGITTVESNKILSFVNLGQLNMTTWVRKANVTGFDVTAREWYSSTGGNEFPSFLHYDDFISDYFVEVIVINGEWTNYLKLAKDPIYGQFFDESGLKSSKSSDFFALREIKVISRTIGCLIPDFKDQSGVTVSIDRLINRAFPTTGLLCALDVEKLDLIDLTLTTFTDQDVQTHRIDTVGHGFDELTYVADDGGYDHIYVGGANTVTLTVPGTGYSPTVGATTTGGSGLGLTVNTTTLTGIIDSFALSAAGTGYSPIIGETTTGGSGSGLTVNTTTLDGIIDSFTLSAAGTGYSPIIGETTTGGSGLGLTVDTTTLTGIIGTLPAYTPGVGPYADLVYSGVIPTVLPVGGTGLTVDVTVSGGVITLITIATPGSGYQVGDIITIDGSLIGGTTIIDDVTFTAIGSGDIYSEIATAVINNPGSGYLVGDIITIDGGGANATVTVSVIHDEIATAVINNPGSGYLVGDIITIDGGGANATVTVSTIHNEIATLTINAAGTGYQVGNIITVNGGGANATFTINSVTYNDIPASAVQLIDTLSYTRPAKSKLIFEIISTITESNFLLGTGVILGDTYIINAAIDYVVAMKGSKLYEAYTSGFLKTGDTSIDDVNPTRYLKVVDQLTNPVGDYIIIETYSDIALVTKIAANTYTSLGTDYFKVELADGGIFKNVFTLTDTAFFGSYSISQPNVLTLTLANPISAGNKALINDYIKVNNYIKANVVSNSRPRLLKIISVSSSIDILSGNITYKVTTMAPTVNEVIGLDVAGNELKVYKGIPNFISNIKGQGLKAFKIRNESLPDGTASRLESTDPLDNSILNYLFTDTLIPQALANGELVDFRYVVDTYSGTISGSSKYQLAKIAALNGQAMAILNAPSMQQFEKSVDPSFIDTTNKLVSTEIIAAGGNLALNPSFLYKFAEEDIKGVPLSSYASYHFPNLIVRSGSKNISVPQAGYISNLYIRKFKNGTPFLIVAGGKRGALSDPEIVGLEYDLTDEDRDFLEPVGFNLTVKRRGFGIILFSNNTAYQRINSALNNAHVRDNLSTIERDIEKILFNFLFDFNDEITRLRVRTIVENYLNAVVNAKGLSTYEVIFDSSNNTNEVISANAAIIDIRVDFPRGIQKFINRITITRVGGSLSSDSSGFIPSF